MARTFRRQRPMQPIADLNVTNLIDLGFTLLIIFMIATPLIEKEQTTRVNLPVETVGAPENPPPETKFQAVTIDPQGRYYFGETLVTVAELRKRLQALAGQPVPPVIRIRADRTLQWQQVVNLIDELKKQRLSKITFDTQTAP